MALLLVPCLRGRGETRGSRTSQLNDAWSPVHANFLVATLLFGGSGSGIVAAFATTTGKGTEGGTKNSKECRDETDPSLSTDQNFWSSTGWRQAQEIFLAGDW